MINVNSIVKVISQPWRIGRVVEISDRDITVDLNGLETSMWKHEVEEIMGIKLLGKAKVSGLVSWVKEQKVKLKSERYYRAITKRDEVWFGLGVKLGENIVYQGESIDPFLKGIGDRFYGDDWNSVLLYRYREGIGINLHKDRKVFERKTVVINFGSAEFIYGKEMIDLKHLDVIEFNNQIIHGVKPVEKERWSLSFRKIKM